MGIELTDDTTLALEKKRTRNRPVKITQLQPEAEISLCQVLFITKSVRRSVVSEIAKQRDEPVLVVGETPGFAKHNGEIGFVIDDRNRVRIEVNLSRSQVKSIELRAQLLEIARKIYRTTGGS